MKVISLQTIAIKRVLEQEGRHSLHPFGVNCLELNQSITGKTIKANIIKHPLAHKYYRWLKQSTGIVRRKETTEKKEKEKN